jgi:Zn-dependent protease with chaperone function
MDFFESQDVARRKTGRLVIYFVLAVVLMIVGLYLVVCAITPMVDGSSESKPPNTTTYSSSPSTSPNYPRSGSSQHSSYQSSQSNSEYKINWWQPKILLIVAVVTIGIVGLGSAYKTAELRGGGQKVASMLGGRRIHPNTSDPSERRLLNVIEEMSLASGVPVPPVYVMDHEEGVNAFAAGYTPSDAVIGVTRGTLNYLSRDELQGVMAHEYSHIFNGDMRLNIRLIGILHGILILTIIGFYLLRFGAIAGRGSRGKKGNPGAYLMILGVAVLILGGVGLIFGRLIKAAVSRQREYLADASAVQFTRNPEGIAGALKKIGGLASGSRVQSPEAESASHMFFANGLKSAAIGSLSTHPPLKDRIKRIDPQFGGQFPTNIAPQNQFEPEEVQVVAVEDKSPFGFRTPMDQFGVVDAIPLEPVVVLGAMGEPNTGHVAYSHDLIASMPNELVDGIHDLFSSRAVVFALLLDDDEAIRQKQLDVVRTKEGEPTEHETIRLAPFVKQPGKIARLPIIEMVQSTLTEMSPEQYETFRVTVDELVKADGKIDLFEFMLQRVLIDHLDRMMFGKKPPAMKFQSIDAVLAECGALISCLARVGHSDEGETSGAYQQAMDVIQTSKQKPALLSKSDCSLKVVSSSLEKLSHGSPLVKKALLSSAMTCIAADGKVTVEESELVRAIADSLDCPIPPISVGPIE